MTNSPETKVKVYRAEDAPPRALAGEVVAVLGYGNLGRTAALNLRDSGIKIRVGNQEDEYAERARSEGFEVVPLALASSDDVVFVLLPDEVIPAVFEREVAPALRPGSAIAFGSGYSLAFDLIHPPESVDVLLVAPRIAEALGVLRAGDVQMTAKVEASLDLFVEQTVGAVLGMAIMTAFEVGRDAGIPAEALALEMYMSGEMEIVFRSFRAAGFFRSSEDHGPTAVFGGMIRTLEMDREAITTRFRAILEDIKSGGFARRFQEEAKNGYPMLDMARAMIHGPSPITDAEA